MWGPRVPKRAHLEGVPLGHHFSTILVPFRHKWDLSPDRRPRDLKVAPYGKGRKPPISGGIREAPQAGSYTFRGPQVGVWAANVKPVKTVKPVKPVPCLRLRNPVSYIWAILSAEAVGLNSLANWDI